MEESLPQTNSMSFVICMELKEKFSSPKTPQQNGVVERKNIIIQEATRTMLNEAKLSYAYWREAVYTVVYILNKGQIRVNKEKTPYE